MVLRMPPFTMLKQKKQRALSVGFIPLEWEYQERNGKRVYVYTRVELLELSCVPVGANPEALSRSKQQKRDFVAAKKQEHEDDKILAEILHVLQRLLPIEYSRQTLHFDL